MKAIETAPVKNQESVITSDQSEAQLKMMEALDMAQKAVQRHQLYFQLGHASQTNGPLNPGARLLKIYEEMLVEQVDALKKKDQA